MLKLVKKEGRSPHWYIRGQINGIQVFESSRTTERDAAELYLQARQGEIYRTAVLKDGGLPTIPTDMMIELVALASRARNRSQKLQRDERITAQFVASLYIQQRGKCAVSGIDFHLTAVADGDTRTRAFAPSLDRKDNAIGYTPENVRLVCRIANFAMNIWGDKALVELSLGVASIWEKSCTRLVQSHIAQLPHQTGKLQ